MIRNNLIYVRVYGVDLERRTLDEILCEIDSCDIPQ
jgi:hypothetical protein